MGKIEIKFEQWRKEKEAIDSIKKIDDQLDVFSEKWRIGQKLTEEEGVQAEKFTKEREVALNVFKKLKGWEHVSVGFNKKDK